MMADPLVQVRFDEAKLRQIERDVSYIPGAMNRIVPPSLNRTATWARTRMAREVSSQTGARVAEGRDRIRIDRATANKWNAQVLIMNARMPVARFATGQNTEGVPYKLPSGRSGTIRHGFFATMASGHRGVFLRSRYVKTGRPIRRERRVSRETGKTYKTELPIYERHLFLHRILKMQFLPPLVLEAGSRLVREITSRVQWQVRGGRK